MKFVLSTQELNFLINKIQNVVSQKPPIPLLSNFLIEAGNNEIKLTATDLAVGMCCNTEATILEEGATTLPAKRFGQLLRELTAANVEISCNDKEITTVISGTSHFKINGMSRNEFPELPSASEGLIFHMKQKDLKDMLFRTAFAAGRDEGRHMLMGVFLKISNQTAAFCATDGKRLARAFCPLETNENITFQCIIPSKAVDEVLKSLLEEGNVRIAYLDNKLSFEMNNTRIVTKLIEGEFPDVSRFIPEKSDINITLHREELFSILRQIVLFTDEHDCSVRFIFSNGELKLHGNAKTLGEGDGSMPVNYEGPKFQIAFDPQNLIDVLRHCTKETITMGLTDSYNPGAIIDGEGLVNPIDASPLFVAMPMRVK